ncbi:MAG: hypothetical protein WCG29_03900 [Desulfomonile sp.]
MSPKRTIKARQILADIKSGLSNELLMDKYNVSLNALQNIFRKLLDANALQEGEVEQRLSATPEKLPVGKQRTLQRNYVFVRLPIYDLENLLSEGLVLDISEEGLQVNGIATKVGEKKGFLVQADYFVDVFPFSFEAECKWASMTEEGEWAAGFKIKSISEGGLEELRKLIRMLSLSD